MQRRTEGERGEPGAGERAQRSTGGDVEGDDHDREVYILRGGRAAAAES
jgi:hypothetical protein